MESVPYRPKGKSDKGKSEIFTTPSLGEPAKQHLRRDTNYEFPQGSICKLNNKGKLLLKENSAWSKRALIRTHTVLHNTKDIEISKRRYPFDKNDKIKNAQFITHANGVAVERRLLRTPVERLQEKVI